VNNISNFENSRWWTAAVLNMVISLYLRGYLSDFDEIWYTDANFDSEDGLVTKNVLRPPYLFIYLFIYLFNTPDGSKQ